MSFKLPPPYTMRFGLKTYRSRIYRYSQHVADISYQDHNVFSYSLFSKTGWIIGSFKQAVMRLIEKCELECSGDLEIAEYSDSRNSIDESDADACYHE